MLKRDEPYQDLGVDWHTRRNDQAHTRRLVAQLERLGHTVIIDPAHWPLLSVESRARRCRGLPCGRVFTGLCLGYAGTGTFRVGQTVHGVGPGALFVARPGQVHEIESTSTDPFGIVFWGFSLRPVARSARLEERGWWSALVDETRPSVSIRVGAIPELVDALAAEAGGPRAGVDSAISTTTSHDPSRSATSPPRCTSRSAKHSGSSAPRPVSR